MNQELIDNKNKMTKLTIFIKESLKERNITHICSFYMAGLYFICKIEKSPKEYMECYFYFDEELDKLKEKFLYHLERNKKWLQ